MKISQLKKKEAKAFTLIEMIGVLAVIAILASLLIPKVFEAINNARINNALVSYNTVKAACIDHYAKYGGVILTTNGTTIGSQTNYYDKQLVQEGFLDKLFLTKIGTTSWVEVVTGASVFPAGGFDLDGDGNGDTAGSTYIIEAVIQGVASSDAKDLNDRLDGATVPFNVTLGADDFHGRVKWSNGVQTAWLYLTHR